MFFFFFLFEFCVTVEVETVLIPVDPVSCVVTDQARVSLLDDDIDSQLCLSVSVDELEAVVKA